MTIIDYLKEGFRYAATCRSLWLFGFFVGLASSGSGGGGGGGDAGAAAGGGLPWATPTMLGIGVMIAAAVALLVVMRFLSEGALIEGVERSRRGVGMTTGEGFRAGWAHWGVLLRIGLIYFATVVGSIVLLGAPVVVAYRAAGPAGALVLGLPALVVAVPWLVTLFLVQAFASRISVLENRHAIDAIRKARLFLHGRLMLGLKLIVAMFLGTFGLTFAGGVVIAPFVLLLVALVRVAQVMDVLPAVVLGSIVVVPAFYVLIAMIGTLRSSIWTIGYLSQVEA